MREFTGAEREFVQAMLLDDLPEVIALRAQLALATISSVAEADLAFQVPADAPRAHLLNGALPVQAWLESPAGRRVGSFTLQVTRGVLTGLQYFCECRDDCAACPTTLPAPASVHVEPDEPRNPRTFDFGFTGFLSQWCPCCDRPGLDEVLRVTFREDRDALDVDELHRDLTILSRLAGPDLAACLRLVRTSSDVSVPHVKARAEEWLTARDQPINYEPCVCPPGVRAAVAAELADETAVFGVIDCPDLTFRFLLHFLGRYSPSRPDFSPDRLQRFIGLAELLGYGDFVLPDLGQW
ncbi:hypothetical protein AB0M43_09220 [Longispora sp. NPDC051575]|uniref:hypothetical protein n=1 Tax=Longispora sp. NPDC051575 TaxID=3154943 RepID=UPI003430C7A0